MVMLKFLILGVVFWTICMIGNKISNRYVRKGKKSQANKKSIKYF